MVEISVEPIGYTKSAQVWNVWTNDGELILERTRNPFLEAGRALANRVDDGEILAMFHDGSPDLAMIGPVRDAARLTVSESDGPPRFKRHKPDVRDWDGSKHRA